MSPKAIHFSETIQKECVKKFPMNVIDRFTKFIEKVFKTSLEVFFQALKMSPNAQGYVGGSITEILLMKKLKSHGLEIKRIREKWEGKKHKNHRGDFYFKYKKNWYVIEVKGIKSNTEAWHKLYNKRNLTDFLIKYSSLLTWIKPGNSIEGQVEKWIRVHLPFFYNKYSEDLYSFEEVKRYDIRDKKTRKALSISKLKHKSQDEINTLISERINYIRSKISVLETHFVSGISGGGHRKQATPRFDEFNLISVDIYLRYPEHYFLFANPNNLPASNQDNNHLKQNYILGFVLTDKQGNPYLSLDDEWIQDINTVLKKLDPKQSVSEEDMQADNRYIKI